MTPIDLGYILVPFILGALLGWAIARFGKNNQISVLEERVSGRDATISELEKVIRTKEERLEELQNESVVFHKEISELQTKLQEERKHTEEKLKAFQDAKASLTETFKSLSHDALKGNNESFIKLAKATLDRHHEKAEGDLTLRQKAIDELVKPIKQSLEKVDTKIETIEKTRSTAYGTLTEQIQSLKVDQLRLQKETANLVTALRRPNVRGRWGEIQLKRVVEMAGMLEYCDFLQQQTGSAEDSRLRPDLIVKLPNEKNIVVDAKAPLDAYLNAVESKSEDERQEKLKDHARQIRSHLAMLSKKSYWDQFEPTPEFAVLFLPGEIFFSAALEQDPSLIEHGVEQRVILATPTTLIALLRAVAYGWRQEQLAENAQEISKLGKELYDRIHTFSKHYTRVRQGLDQTIRAYNDSIGTLESRVMVSARKIKDLGAGSHKELPEMEVITETPRALQSPEKPKKEEENTSTKPEE